MFQLCYFLALPHSTIHVVGFGGGYLRYWKGRSLETLSFNVYCPSQTESTVERELRSSQHAGHSLQRNSPANLFCQRYSPANTSLTAHLITEVTGSVTELSTERQRMTAYILFFFFLLNSSQLSLPPQFHGQVVLHLVFFNASGKAKCLHKHLKSNSMNFFFTLCALLRPLIQNYTGQRSPHSLPKLFQLFYVH